jgi:dTDP-4-dehydrorhamnose 3,5-epimerase
MRVKIKKRDILEMRKTRIPEVLLISPQKYGDHRGFFSETYNSSKMGEIGVDITFVQDNQSLSVEANTLRGLHYQVPPFAQDKLVRVLQGSILDVTVDIRRGSPTFGEHISEIISAQEWNQILVPKGFAHGFITLEPNTEVLYKVSDYYAPKFDFGIKWDDPDLEINWGVDASDVILSEKDQNQPMLQEIITPFEYEGKL